MKIRTLFLIAIFPVVFASCHQSGQQQPNIIIFFTDDNGFEYWGFSGGPDLSPTVDAIAANGLIADHAYISASVCTPSRYALHTGKFAGRCQESKFLADFPTSGPYNITWNTFLDPARETTMGQLLQEGGYTTGFVGKWHLGWDHDKFSFQPDDDPANPEINKKLKAFHAEASRQIKEAGFDYAESVTPINIDNHPVKAVQYHNLEWFAKGAMDFLDEYAAKEDPFFLIVNITTHHGPCHIPSIEKPVNLTPAGYVDGLEGIMPPRESIFERITRKGYPVDFKTAGTVWTDDCVEAVMKKLRETGKADETLVIFTTDHNRYDGKATCYEGGVHIPFVAQFPGTIYPGTTLETYFQLTDLMPTLLEAGKIPMPEELEIDGKSIWKQLSGETSAEVHDALYFEFGYSRGILKDGYKYIAVRFPDEITQRMENDQVDKAIALRGKVTDEPCFLRYPHLLVPDQLYDLENDPDEQVNLAGQPEYAERLKEMQDELWSILETFDHPFVREVNDFYYSEKFDLLREEARKIDMEQFYWYNQGCY